MLPVYTHYFSSSLASRHDSTPARGRRFLPDGPSGTRIGAWRFGSTNPDTTLVVHPSVEQATDGDDYIEGNGGDDTIFGGLGQDDIVGDSSDLYLSGLVGQLVTIDGQNVVAGLPVLWRVVERLRRRQRPQARGQDARPRGDMRR